MKFNLQNRLLLSILYFYLPYLTAGAGIASTPEQYIGSKRCVPCHLPEFNDWKDSDHFKSMSPASSDSVLGDFSDTVVQFQGVTSNFFRKGDQYYIDTLNQQGKQETFNIRFTFGYKPLQQYLVSTVNGHLQAFNVAWDSRNIEDGGQKWFHLRDNENITQESLFFWTKHFQNWNNRCAECHSTNVDKNYSPKNMVYQTTWSEINVACEACHGSAGEHVVRVESGEYDPLNSGFKRDLLQTANWFRSPKESVARHDSYDITKNQLAILDTCGGCHSRRASLGKSDHDKSFHDQFRLQTLDEELYFDDGQIKAEVFVMGSFMQSKMYNKGVTCANCHNSHSGKVLMNGNDLCLQCHSSEKFNRPKHHGHVEDSAGSQCVNCHMPSRTYMGVDDRRDHSFTLPRPNLSINTEVPNACTSCHLDRTNEWAIEFLSTKGQDQSFIEINEIWSKANAKMRESDPIVLTEINAIISNGDLSKIKVATLLNQLALFPLSNVPEFLINGLKDKSPIVRRSAVSALKNVNLKEKTNLLFPLLTDPDLSVRNEIALLLVKEIDSIPNEFVSKVQFVLDEYKQTLLYNIDSPINLVALANFELLLGDHKQAEKHYLKALKIEPGYIPAILNIADYYRAQGNENEAGRWLLNAVNISENNAAAQHALGLHFIRINKIRRALKHLELATKSNGVQARYMYIYALALSNIGNKEESIDNLMVALIKWPNNFGLLTLLVSTLDDSGRSEETVKYRIQLRNLVTAMNKKL